jgi:hypothetical protein
MKALLSIVVFLSFISFQAFSQLPNNGIIGYWPFSGNAKDTIGNNDGTLNGATLCADRFGNANQAYYFDGIDDNISLLFNNSIDINTKSTIMLWFKAEITQNAYAKLLCVPYSLVTWDNPYHYFAFSKNSGDGFRYANFENGRCQTEPFTEDIDTIWNLIAFTYDEGNIKVYTNGILQETLSCAQTLLPNGFSMSIGSRSTNKSNDGEFFTGIIDDISIYNRVLTQDEITSYYENKCSVSYVDEISTYYVSDVSFKKTNNQIYLDSIENRITNNGCDLIVKHYSKFVYQENFFSDSIAVTDTLIIDVAFSSINNEKNVNRIKVYPNPTNDIITINTGNEYQQISNYSIRIIDTKGVLFFESKISKSLFEINLKDFGKTGLYYIQIVDNSNKVIELRKIILK